MAQRSAPQNLAGSEGLFDPSMGKVSNTGTHFHNNLI